MATATVLLPVAAALPTPPPSPESKAEDNSDQPLESQLDDALREYFFGPPRTRRPQKVPAGMQDLELLSVLGTGSFSKVWLVAQKEQMKLAPLSANGARRDEGVILYALKQVGKANVILKHQSEHIYNELNLLRSLQNNPFVPRYINHWQDRSSIYLLQEYTPGGELFNMLRKRGRFDYATTKFYAAEIAMCLMWLHRDGIVYRDLKPENILLDARGHVRLIDFGFAKHIGRGRTHTICGTPEYISPESLSRTGHYKSVDWWSFGILIYEMFTGSPPFYGDAHPEIYERIRSGVFAPPKDAPKDLKLIIKQLLRLNPFERLGHWDDCDVLEHEFFRDVNWGDLQFQRNEGPIIPVIKHTADTSNFPEYEGLEDSDMEFTDEMFREFNGVFADF